MSGPVCCHDHVVLLVDSDTFEDPPAWLKDNFNIIEGGVHGGGSSRNKLIVFADGTYIELFNWISTPTEFTAWAQKQPGLIDFALTTVPPVTAQDNFDAVTARLGQDHGDGELGVKLFPPKPGGRRRTDGVEVKWEVTRPEYSAARNTPDAQYFPTERLDAPFFCHDVTPREVRVPFTDSSVTSHPCGATGILSVEVLVPEASIDSYINLYTSLTGTTPTVHGGYRYSPTTSVTFHIGSPVPVPSSSSSTLSSSISRSKQPGQVQVSIELHAPRDQDDDIWLRDRGIGIRSLQLFVPGTESEGYDEQVLDSEGIGATITLISDP